MTKTVAFTASLALVLTLTGCTDPELQLWLDDLREIHDQRTAIATEIVKVRAKLIASAERQKSDPSHIAELREVLKGDQANLERGQQRRNYLLTKVFPKQNALVLNEQLMKWSDAKIGNEELLERLKITLERDLRK